MTEEQKQTTSIPAGIAAFASYFFPFIGGLVFLALERENRFIRFHAAQSIVFWICSIPVAILNFIPVIGWLVSVLFILVWFFLMYQSWRGRMVELPVLGELARRQVFDDGGPGPAKEGPRGQGPPRPPEEQPGDEGGPDS
jgi:uncharacterized membrane protein